MDYLPVFLDLTARPVLVVGGGAVASRKVELLLKAHAKVRVVAPCLHPELRVFRDAGRIEHLAGEFEPQQLEGMQLVIAATDREEINRAVAAAAAARSLFVNVVDSPSDSSCIMPAIVDRSPIIVAIGTGGHAPVLARRLRAQIEALLPERLGELARLAGRVRERVARLLPDLRSRRRFWERLFSGSVATQVLAGHAAEAEQLLERELEQARVGVAQSGAAGGEVYLIGAGPGDPDLLTLRALQLLQQADVVLYDRLVSEAVLARARRDATRIFVGKAPGQHRGTQERIHALMLEHAQRGQRVARLKGGDPSVFGRAGEELEALRRAGIPVVIAAGVTAALGAAASACLPLTQRGRSQSLTLVTATGEGADRLDWRSLAAPLQTVVFYMGIAQLPRIVERLRTHGAPPERWAAIVERATLPEQRVLAAPLAEIVERAQQHTIVAPALLIVGEVAEHACEGAVRDRSSALLEEQWVHGSGRMSSG
jgi:uroporphyrin-III C-methyltransferase/precorrin-2 dehydrogenase/sirohydrochlorin ferrochelatase